MRLGMKVSVLIAALLLVLSTSAFGHGVDRDGNAVNPYDPPEQAMAAPEPKVTQKTGVPVAAAPAPLHASSTYVGGGIRIEGPAYWRVSSWGSFSQNWGQSPHSY